MDPQDLREKFIALAWMQAGVSIAHLLRFFLFDDPMARKIIAGTAVVLYGLTAVLLVREKLAGVWIAIIGPLVGVTLVLLTHNHVDAYQIGIGVSQFVGVGYGIRLLVTRK